MKAFHCKSKTRFSSLVIVVLWSALGSAFSRQITTAAQPSEVRVVLHQPVSLRLVIQNGSLEPIQFDLGPNRTTNIVVTSIGPQGIKTVGHIPYPGGFARV